MFGLLLLSDVLGSALVGTCATGKTNESRAEGWQGDGHIRGEHL